MITLGHRINVNVIKNKNAFRMITVVDNHNSYLFLIYLQKGGCGSGLCRRVSPGCAEDC